MRILLGAIAALALSATAALAGDEVMASRFGNTTITTDASGQSSKIYYEADHSFTGVQGEQQLAGSWAVKGSQVCLTFTSDAPPGYPNPICTPVSNHAVGETWTAGPFTVQLVEGRQ
ncbi:MAG: hypothetical protein Q7U20_11150 [Caulobacter sp.]|nr:hypothetical protein [Caulobacter sp.]